MHYTSVALVAPCDTTPSLPPNQWAEDGARHLLAEVMRCWEGLPG